MRADTFSFTADDGAALFVHRFLPDGPVRAVMHVAHGMAEHGARYARLAEALTAAGFAVYADDHRGHGRTAPTAADLGFVASKGGWPRLVRDLEQLIAHEKAQHPGLPVTLFGHSMGSYIAQSYLLDHGRELHAVVLSGSSGSPKPLAQAGRLVARLERLRRGERGTSPVLTGLSFGAFNKQFAPTRTAFDWLSRDPAEVDAYVADPHCGFECSTTLWIDLLDGTARAADPARQRAIPHALPIYVVSGSRDPVGENGKAVERLVEEYARAGLTEVTCRLYPEARHELLNETNRAEVTRDLLAWLEEIHPR
jgi:alpha-beta hydrolase superfamily lysophospholipase